MISLGLSFRVVKTRDCMVMSKHLCEMSIQHPVDAWLTLCHTFLSFNDPEEKAF